MLIKFIYHQYKYLFKFFFISFIGLVLGCNSPLKIEIEGTPGLKFSGSIEKDGQISLVEGIVPTIYNIFGKSFYGAFKKEEIEGILTAKITQKSSLEGDKVLDEETTTIPYGYINVSYSVSSRLK